MAYDEKVAERLSNVFAKNKDVVEKKMFGGVAFMLNGNMLCGYTNKGKLMVRVGKELEAEARQLPGAQDMDFTGKKMGGMLFVDDEALVEDDSLARWVALATRFVGTLPAK